MDNSFDLKFMSDEELQNAMDEFVNSVKDDVAADEEKTTVLNPIKLQQMQFAHAALKYITRDSDVEISYKLNTPFKTMGSISVEGEVLALTNQSGLREWQSLQTTWRFIHWLRTESV